jgi:hypothetical protein
VIERPDVRNLLAKQHWVASTDQLLERGVSTSALYRARRSGKVTTPVPGTVAMAGVELTFLGRAMAAQLGAGPEAFVSGESAASIRGLRGMSTRRIEVTVKEHRRVSHPDWCRVIRTSWIDDERDVEIRDDGLRVASPLRMLFRLAAHFNQHRFERAAEDVWHMGLVAPDQAWEFLQANRRSGRAGVRRMEAWLEKTSVRQRPAHSGLELDLLDMIERAGLPTPERQHPVLLPSGETIHLDVAWPDVRLAIEPGHSWWHGGDLAQRRDQARDRACGAVGWMVVRFDEDARCHPAATAREIVAVYRRRLADSPAS